MTNEEAIVELRDVYGHATYLTDRRTAKAFALAIVALEKQIPKKPIIENGHCYCPNRCPSVTKDTLYWTVGRGENYCDRCGQAIDWTKEQTDDSN